MIPPAFEYLRPTTIPEAIAFLQQYGDDAKILSGGQSLIPMMKLRIARPALRVCPISKRKMEISRSAD